MMRKTTTCGIATAVALLASRDAFADTFRYVDREGRVHEIAVDAEGPPPAPDAPPHPPPPASLESRVPDALWPYASIIRQACALYQIPPELALAVIKVESGFNPRAVSRTGAMGLMQLMPQTAQLLSVGDPFDPRQNIFGGVRYLRVLLNAFDGDVALAVAAYNIGAGAVRRAGKVVPSVPETQKYVASVLALYHLFARANGTSPT